MRADLKQAAAQLGGEVTGAQVLCPGPGHSHHDRSLSVRFGSTAPDGFVVYSFAGDDPITCRDHVRQALGMAPFAAHAHYGPEPGPAISASPTPASSDNVDKAQYLWRRAQPLAGTKGERYLRKARGIRAPLPPTIRFLPPSAAYPATLVSAFAIPAEPEPGVLTMQGISPRAVHLTKLSSDGLKRTDKRILASPAGVPIVCSAWTDSLGLIICEGIEDALSAFEATGIACWAAGSATHMPRLAEVVPEWADCITIVEDDDDAGRRAVAGLANALTNRGLFVEVTRLRRAQEVGQ
ncbi:toprim domain-containing protein [Acuticoccus sp. M5D2P5]|uniref:toprim domain-containing protein n=1 Tax=Acuticoccus kalidii TaxID=2910977 RepID=UPI001F18D2F7|nr:toprim domain-containing protein [Acuticoccus kalidii]MCF3935312.1 toprim domain-containing protein [Acuticoccus kalidii]